MIEVNGSGEILWEKTINETSPILNDGRPYYFELYTKKRFNDDFNYFKRLHECILTHMNRELKEADILDLLDFPLIYLSDESLASFGDREYILCQIEKELKVQFNTRKQFVLSAIYAYIKNKNPFNELEQINAFGTNNFNIVWENVCAEVMGNQLQVSLSSLPLPNGVHENFRSYDSLLSVIEKPKWMGSDDEGDFTKISGGTLTPDVVTVHQNCEGVILAIFDAKYYVLNLERGRKLTGQPGVGDVSKQYLYQLALKDFIEVHDIHHVRNCFLMPSEGEMIINAGVASFGIMKNLDLRNIQVRLLPAYKMYELYLDGKILDISNLRL